MTSAVVVTGAAGGIGTALCERVRRDGHRTIGIDRFPVPAADTWVEFDLRNTADLAQLGRDLAVRHEIRAVVHNAAMQPIAVAGDTPPSEWDDVFRVNVIAIDALVSGLKESLAAHHGSIVVVGSVHGRATSGGVTAYATSKAALEGWVRSAALDLGPEIRVNAVAPGAIDTEKLREGFARWGEESAAQRRAVLCDRTALRRIGTPSEIAGAVSFLIGADASFVTGAVLVVDGGATARLGSE